MSDLEVKERDAFDGGFAVVDRERLIEEETKVVTPWYKHFIHSIIAPNKMMEENLLCEPPKGNSIAVVGSILAILLIAFFQNMNPQIRQGIYDTLRQKDIAEDMLGQQYIVTMVVGIIVSFIGILAIALVQSIVLQIIKAIAKDKCKFAGIFTVIFLGLFIGLVVQAADYFVANLIDVNYLVFNLGSLINRTALLANNKLMVLMNFFSLERVFSVAYMIMGYSLIAHKSKKQATIRIMILQIIILVFSLISA